MSGQEKVRSIDADRLSMISRMSQAVTTIPKNDLDEMKSYANPPVAVKDTMEAVSVLLGKNDTSWKAIKKYMADVSSEHGLLKQISERDPECITPEQRQKANALMSPYTPEKIKNTSKALTKIYEWGQAVAED